MFQIHHCLVARENPRETLDSREHHCSRNSIGNRKLSICYR